MERNRPRDAIICLQRIWSANRLLEHQQARLEDLKSKLQAAETGPRGDPYARIVFEQLISKLNREIANLRKIENFDAAVRLRLAAAYQAIGVIVNQPSSWNRWSKICHPTASWSRPPPILSNLGSAFTLLQAEDPRQAIAEFERFEEQYPQQDLREDALDWRGVGLSLQREFTRAREVMDVYLSTFKSGRYRASATLKRLIAPSR